VIPTRSHAHIALTTKRGGSAPSLLLKAAEQLTTLDAGLAAFRGPELSEEEALRWL
jgi:hypothetical protein